MDIDLQSKYAQMGYDWSKNIQAGEADIAETLKALQNNKANEVIPDILLGYTKGCEEQGIKFTPDLDAPKNNNSTPPKEYYQEWLSLPSLGGIFAGLIVQDAAEQRRLNRQEIQATGNAMAENLEKEADEMKKGAAWKLGMAIAAGVVNIATSAIAIRKAGAAGGTDATARVEAAKSQAIQSIGQATGSILNAIGDFVQTSYNANIKKLEADSERIRTMQEQLKQTNEALRDLISKALDFANSMQANMNQTRTKILG